MPLPARAMADERRGDSPGSGRDAAEALVYEPDNHRTLADRGRATLDRARPHVARREDPGNTRFEQTIRARFVAGQHEALAVARHEVIKPVGTERGAEEQEQEAER